MASREADDGRERHTGQRSRGAARPRPAVRAGRDRRRAESAGVPPTTRRTAGTRAISAAASSRINRRSTVSLYRRGRPGTMRNSGSLTGVSWRASECPADSVDRESRRVGAALRRQHACIRPSWITGPHVFCSFIAPSWFLEASPGSDVRRRKNQLTGSRVSAQRARERSARRSGAREACGGGRGAKPLDKTG